MQKQKEDKTPPLVPSCIGLKRLELQTSHRIDIQFIVHSWMSKTK